MKCDKRSLKSYYLILLTIVIYFFSLNSVYALPIKNDIVKKENNQKESIKEKIQLVTQDKPLKHIMIIVIDGIELGTFERLNLPNLKGLWSTGVKTNQAISVFPSNIKSVTENILTGKDNLNDNENNKKVSNIIEIIKGYDKKTAFIDNTEEKLDTLIKSSDILESMPNEKGKDVIDKAIEIFKEKKPYLLGMTLRDPLLAQMGLNNKENYNKSIISLDNQIGRLIYYLTETGLYDNTLTIVVGVNNYNSNKNILTPIFNRENILNSLIIRGPGIKAEEKVSAIKLRDVMPTINFLFNGKINEEVEGKVLWNIIKKQGYIDGYLMNKRIKDLSDEQIEYYYNLIKMKNNKIELLTEQKKVRDEKRSINSLINSKDQEIKKLGLKFKLLKVSLLVLVVFFILGYIIEYYLLRKRFLLF